MPSTSCSLETHCGPLRSSAISTDNRAPSPRARSLPAPLDAVDSRIGLLTVVVAIASLERPVPDLRTELWKGLDPTMESTPVSAAIDTGTPHAHLPGQFPHGSYKIR